MGFKEFFKPSWIKIIFFLILFVVSSLPWVFQLTPYSDYIDKINEKMGCGKCCDTTCVYMNGLPIPFYILVYDILSDSLEFQ